AEEDPTTRPRACVPSRPGGNSLRPAPPELDFVFTVCDNAAGEICPVWPGQPMTAHWGVPDPAEFTGGEVEKAAFCGEVMRMLYNCINIFAALPIRSLDRLSLQKHLDDIGKTKA
ncbi:MAG: ArsR family transcriptional regulator, partial [Magnetospirillum sp.]|nr:ArsR family transcriptional regulator [Magnetospirillum sp.]